MLIRYAMQLIDDHRKHSQKFKFPFFQTRKITLSAVFLQSLIEACIFFIMGWDAGNSILKGKLGWEIVRKTVDVQQFWHAAGHLLILDIAPHMELKVRTTFSLFLHSALFFQLYRQSLSYSH